MMDITDRKKADERFRIVAEVVSDLIYEWDVETDSLTWYDDIDKILGYDKGEIDHTIVAWATLIHPEDQERLAGSVEFHRVHTETIHEEYRIRQKNGDYLYCEDIGMPLLNEQGKPYKWFGSCRDITIRKGHEKNIESSP